MKNNFLTVENVICESNLELYITFSLSGKVYSILADQINEIIQLPALNIIEKLPNHIVGLINFKGKIINVIDLRRYLGTPVTKYSIDHQILIVNSGEKNVGIIVDSVNDVIQFDRNNLEPLPYQSKDGYILGIYKNDDEMVAFLNLNLILQNVTSVEISQSELEVPDSIPADLFPTDPVSVEKLKKRALKLQKEFKFDIYKDGNHEDKFVSFSLNHEIYCIGLKYVKEFRKLKLVNLTPIPCVPAFMLGLVNLRGEFITVVDIKGFLQIPKSQTTDKTKIIIVKTPHLQLGLIVDDVFDIVDIHTEKLSLDVKPAFEKTNFTAGEVLFDDGRIMSIFDLEKFLENERLFIEDAI